MILFGSLQGIFHTALYHVLIGSYMVIYQTTSVQFKWDRCAIQTYIVKCKILYMSVYLFEFLFGIHVRADRKFCAVKSEHESLSTDDILELCGKILKNSIAICISVHHIDTVEHGYSYCQNAHRLLVSQMY